MQIARRKIHDVCIVGSGAGGGFMAKELTAAGADTLLLEAGSKINLNELHLHELPYDLPYRGVGFNAQAPLYRDVGKVEFTKTKHNIDRIRVLGGRTVHWNAMCLRFSPSDFREHSLNGIEEDWPLTYEELSPYYDSVEQQMHVFGTREGLSVLPDGNFVAESPRLRCSELIVKNKLEKLGIRMIPVRKAVLLKSQAERGACHYCGHCMDVCDVRAIWSSDITVIPEALATGRLTLRVDALAREIVVDRDGLASGVSFVDRVTGKEEKVYARIVVVSCSTVESARLLLNSTSEKHPNGLANSNDVVGRHLGGHMTSSFLAYLTDLVGRDLGNQDGMTDHAYIPRFDLGQNHLIGGFGIQPNLSPWYKPSGLNRVSGFGAGYKRRVRELFPAKLHFGMFAKVLHRPQNRVTVNRKNEDKYGIPLPRIDFEFSDQDKTLYRVMNETVQEILASCGTEMVWQVPQERLGFGSHEVGAVRMGKNPRTSVLNSYCQSHEVKNLFVVDGGCFTSSPEKNPTLTIAALAVRSARYITRQRRSNQL